MRSPSLFRQLHNHLANLYVEADSLALGDFTIENVPLIGTTMMRELDHIFALLGHRRFVKARVQAGIDSAEQGKCIPSGEVRRRLKVIISED